MEVTDADRTLWKAHDVDVWLASRFSTSFKRPDPVVATISAPTMGKDYYKILGVSKTAGDDEIKKGM